MTSTYDHRIIQGAESGRFLQVVEAYLQGEHGFYDGVFASLGAELGPPPAPPAPAAAAAAAREAPAPRPPRDGASTSRCCRPCRPPPRCSRPTARTATSPPGWTRWAPSPRATRRSSPTTVGLTPEIMARIPAKILRMYVPGATLADALPHLRETYCGTIAYEIEHIASHRQRMWLREKIEGSEFRKPLTNDEQHALLQRLIEVDALERFMHKAYLGQKQFSIEGLDMTVPMLDEIDPARRGARRARGRHRHGAPRPAQRARPQPRPPLRDDLRRVRGRLDARGRDHDPAGRHRRRQVPPRRAGHLPAARRRRDPRQPRVQPVAPRVRAPGRRRRHARRADRPPGPARPPRHQRRGADRPARRRRLPRPGRRRRVAEPAGARRLQGRRHAPPDPEQPGRLHHRPRGRALHALGLGPRQGLRRADHPRQRRRRGRLHRRRAPRLRLPRGVRPRRRHRPHRLPPLRPQRGRRARVHAARDVREDQGQEARQRAVRRAARRGGRRHPGGGRAAAPGRLGRAHAPAPGAQGADQGRRGRRRRRAADRRVPARPLALARGPDRGLARAPAQPQRGAAAGPRRLHRPPQARQAARAPPPGASAPTAASTGRTPSRSPSPRC